MLVPVAHTVARPGNRHDGPGKKYFGNNINFILFNYYSHKRNLAILLFSFVKAFLQLVIFIMSSFLCKLRNQIFCFLKMLEMPFRIL